MRTTLQINDSLYRRAKQKALESHRSLTQVVEEGLRLALATQSGPIERVEGLILAPFGGQGVQAGIDLDDMGTLLDAMDRNDTAGR
jgi:hypothetical protein